MHIEFHGAVRTVTGSCFLLQVNDKRVLIDCGMFQGGKKIRRLNEKPFRFNPKSIDAVLSTHGHIDHSGLLPKLVKDGFAGPIYATRATADLLLILLKDSAHIQQMDAEWASRKARRAGLPIVEPMYTLEDAEKTLDLLKPIRYRKEVKVFEGITAVFHDAGHILGSSFIEVTVEEGGRTKKIVFSGDVGNLEQAIIKDPAVGTGADYLLIESTYGDRNHKKKADTMRELAEILVQAYKDGGNVVIPAFAVGRTQEILYQLYRLSQEGRLPDFDIYVDSPMAISATKTYREHEECFDTETIQILMSGKGPFSLPKLTYSRSTEQSRAINFNNNPKIIISASGMCDAGRILHHLKHNLWKRNAHIVFVGYQAHGSLGRRIIEGVPKVKIFREEVAVVAKIHTIGGLSAHADQKGLLDWAAHLTDPKPKVFVVHGEEEASSVFAQKLKSQLGLEAILPTWHEKIRL